MQRSFDVLAGLVWLLLAACGDTNDTNAVGAGGSGGSSPVGGATSSGSSSSGGGASTTATGGNGAGGNGAGGTGSGGETGGAVCDDIGNCFGDQSNPETGCYECAIVGDATLAVDGGKCQNEHLACFGSGVGCSGGNPECCALSNCMNYCAPNDPACEEACANAHPNGVSDYDAVFACMFEDVCARSCS